MKKHLIAWLLLALPAILVSFLYRNDTLLSEGLQWGCAILMVLGWSVNTGLAARRYPRTTLSLLLFYTGVTVFLVTMKYSVTHPVLRSVLREWGGVLSYRPLQIVIDRLLFQMNIPHELCVTGGLLACLLTGWVTGAFYHKFHPNPYRPRMVVKR